MGILLLNSVLTVEKDNPKIALYKGIYEVIEIVSQSEIILNRKEDPDNYPRINPNNFELVKHYS